MGGAQSRNPSTSNNVRRKPSLIRHLHRSIKKTYRKILKRQERQYKLNVPAMPRCSSFIDTGCDHCSHRHLKKCCRDSGESKSDARSYAKWKMGFEFPSKPIRPIRILGLSEALTGQFSPQHFPAYSEKIPWDTLDEPKRKHRFPFKLATFKLYSRKPSRRSRKGKAKTEPQCNLNKTIRPTHKPSNPKKKVRNVRARARAAGNGVIILCK